MYFKIDSNNVIIASASHLNNPEGFIRITDGNLENVRVGLDKIIDGQIVKATQEETAAHEQKHQAMLDQSQTQHEIEQNKVRRNTYLDAYRRYQAAVNYGEFERVPTVDEFVKRLYNRDWAAMDSAPSQIKYFVGEIEFASSGLYSKTER